MTDTAWDAIALHPDDDVAVVLRACADAHNIRVRIGNEIRVVVCGAPIAMAHKIALRARAPGEPVTKYGEVIGEASAAIAVGDHVHVHNLRSRRARKAAP